MERKAPRNIRQILKAQGLRQGPPNVLVIGNDTDSQDTLVNALTPHHHHCACAAEWNEAKDAASRNHYDVLLIDVELIEEDAEPLEALCSNAGNSKIIIYTRKDPRDDALTAIRVGAVDIVSLIDDGSDLAGRIEEAVVQSRSEEEHEQRMARLRNMCKELNVARLEVSDQVESLCDELASAYRHVADKVSDATMVTEFRTLISQELDVEDMLRTSLEYLLTKTGPTNAAVFLPDEDKQFNLGAYVNYDCPRSSITPLLEHMSTALCPQMMRDHDIVMFDDSNEFCEWIGVGEGVLEESQVVALACHHNDECMAVMILFRAKTSPFETELASILDNLRMPFAEQIERVVRVHQRATPSWPEEYQDDENDFDDFGFGFPDSGGLAA